MELTVSLTAITSCVEEFKKETKKRNGKSYKGFITFSVDEKAETLTITADDGDVHLNQTLFLMDVEGTFKFQMHISHILNVLGCMSEKPIRFYVKPPFGRVCFKVVAECGMLIE